MNTITVAPVLQVSLKLVADYLTVRYEQSWKKLFFNQILSKIYITAYENEKITQTKCHAMYTSKGNQTRLHTESSMSAVTMYGPITTSISPRF